ncbi:SH3 domain-containing protein [Pseudoxanthomonas sp. Root630]|uniref:SH3 domain-containing protein n=1 Tax=Pseudoxanthomonas sp. Root630 TaxID=1736574 RepID=UPI0009D7339D|nr:SH3 domain-containing protein [Pseudoxanthomonas sp. Root630]
MGEKIYQVELHKKFHAPKGYPQTIKVRVIANLPYQAEDSAKAQNPHYETKFNAVKEIKEPSASGSNSSGSTSSGDDLLGCSGILKGCITLVGLLIVFLIVSQCSDKGGNPSSSPATTSIPEANLKEGAPQGAAREESLIGMSTTARQQLSAEQAQSIADAASRSAAPEVAPGLIGSRARIVDSRDRIVLQSGPKMSSRNVAKIDSGSTVQVLSDEGRWVQVRTEDGQVGYVRRKQLESVQ